MLVVQFFWGVICRQIDKAEKKENWYDWILHPVITLEPRNDSFEGLGYGMEHNISDQNRSNENSDAKKLSYLFSTEQR